MIQIFRSVLARKVPATLACARLADSTVGTQIFRSFLARKVPATLACARLLNSIVGTYFQRATRK